MKTITKTFVLSLICVLSFQFTAAQPTMSSKYTDTEVDGMIRAYKTSHSKDVRPSVVLQQQFIKDFPKARDIEWEVAANIYEAEFEIGRTDYKAYYDRNAGLLMYIQEVRGSELPAIVKNGAEAKYPNYKFDDIKRIVKGKEIFYQVEMKKEQLEIKATFRENGTFVKEILD